MLSRLRIQHFAVIEQSDIEFKAGLNILSGETGAGKSIVIDAVNLIGGARADYDFIRHGSEQAQIYAFFSELPDTARHWLEEQCLSDADAPDACHIRRSLSSGNSKAFINDMPQTAGNLRLLSQFLLVTHGQHANQFLLKSEGQRRYLDHYAQLHDELKALRETFRVWQALQEEYAHWQTARQEREEKTALLAYQLEEFTQCAPQQGEFAEITARHKLLSQAGELIHDSEQLLALLRNEEGVYSQLYHAVQQLEHLNARNPAFQTSLELLQQSLVYVDEAADSLQHERQHLESDPETLQTLDERMSLLYALARKHHIDPEQLAQYHQEIQRQYQEISHEIEHNSQLGEQLLAAKERYQQAAAHISQVRHHAALSLAAEVNRQLRHLGMENAEFRIDIQEDIPSIHGSDRINFNLRANLGSDFKDLAKIASGGELSRISLAIQVASLDDAAIPTLIFDEIDAGIGGETANVVGEMLATLAKNRQIICITHLPQVAAWADHHYFIDKIIQNGNTATVVRELDATQRREELARMLGSRHDSASLQHAERLLQHTQKSL